MVPRASVWDWGHLFPFWTSEDPSVDLGAVRCLGWRGQRLDGALAEGEVEALPPRLGGRHSWGSLWPLASAWGVGSTGTVRMGQV